MYAKIIDEETKLCEVGTGTNSEFYKSIGMTEMEVEQAWDGSWYVKGYVPEQPQEEIKAQRIVELKAELNSTDYKIIKCSECSLAGEELPYDIAELHAERQALRDEINQLEEKNG